MADLVPVPPAVNRDSEPNLLDESLVGDPAYSRISRSAMATSSGASQRRPRARRPFDASGPHQSGDLIAADGVTGPIQSPRMSNAGMGLDDELDQAVSVARGLALPSSR
jgi:hypothetical protein